MTRNTRLSLYFIASSVLVLFSPLVIIPILLAIGTFAAFATIIGESNLETDGSSLGSFIGTTVASLPFVLLGLLALIGIVSFILERTSGGKTQLAASMYSSRPAKSLGRFASSHRMGYLTGSVGLVFTVLGLLNIFYPPEDLIGANIGAGILVTTGFGLLLFTLIFVIVLRTKK